MKNTDKEGYQLTRRLRTTEGEMAYHLDVFGDHIAKREGYREHKGLDALHYFLMQKHHWVPSQVRSLSWDDLRFAVAEEMADGTCRKMRDEAAVAFGRQRPNQAMQRTAGRSAF